MDGIPKHKNFGGKQYTLEKAFLSKSGARALAKILRGQGYLARIYEEGGEMHFLRRFHVYKRRK